MLRHRSILPGFGLTMGYTVLYLSLIVLLPIAALFLMTTNMGWDRFAAAVFEPRVVASYRLTFLTSLLAACLNAVFGLVVAWTLVRYEFPGKRLIDGLIDLPFALPTAVSGIVLTAVYSSNGWIGKWLANAGIKVAYTPAGIVVALVFIGVPFVVRMLQPAIEDLDPEMEEAAESLGANRLQTFFRVILPTITPALVTGFTLAFARALGEYGSVIFISGNMPMRTEITSLLIVTKLEQYDFQGAAAIAVLMLTASFAILLGINVLQWWTARKFGRVV